ncbi:cyclophilin-like fold protein [Pseudomonas sp. 30_B]|uniref:cyclophilin-like fold protein n=1 Tax=Pseudomonas sp. 30_B TaxID=2813575 RepID=UPI001A9E4A25|nr:cyclophilin-like fold protein [Pseudomonas sp. 30_B]
MISQHFCRTGVRLCLLLMLSGCVIAAPKPKEERMWMTVGDKRFAITLDDSETARAFAQLLPLTLDMTELNANEKYASLPQRLPARSVRLGTIRNGDLMLYGNDTLVIFYQTFESTYAYTHLGRVDSPDQLVETLGKGNVSVHFSTD